MADVTKFGSAKCKGIDDFLRPDHLISAETKMFCKSLRKFVNNEILPHEDELDDYWDWTERKEHTFVHDIWKKLLIDLGLQKSFIPPSSEGPVEVQRWMHVPRSKKFRGAILALHVRDS